MRRAIMFVFLLIGVIANPFKPDAQNTGAIETPKPTITHTANIPTPSQVNSKVTATAIIAVIQPTPSPSQESTPTPKASAKPTRTPTASPATSTRTPKPTSTATPSPRPTDEPVASLSSGYIDDVLRGINDARAEEGLSPVTLNSDLSGKAEDHARQMAEEKRSFHSKYGLIESVAQGSEGGMSGYSVGVRSATHAHEIKDDPGITKVGIGAVKRDGRIYVCVLAE